MWNLLIDWWSGELKKGLTSLGKKCIIQGLQGGFNVLDLHTWNKAAMQAPMELLQEERQVIGAMDRYILWEGTSNLGCYSNTSIMGGSKDF